MDLLIFVQVYICQIHFFSGAHGTYTKIDHILSHKKNLITFKRNKITWTMFSDHSEIELKHRNGKVAEISPALPYHQYHDSLKGHQNLE